MINTVCLVFLDVLFGVVAFGWIVVFKDVNEPRKKKKYDEMNIKSHFLYLNFFFKSHKLAFSHTSLRFYSANTQTNKKNHGFSWIVFSIRLWTLKIFVSKKISQFYCSWPIKKVFFFWMIIIIIIRRPRLFLILPNVLQLNEKKKQ